MAIKGRSRTRGRRGPARPPRPAPVAVRTPMLLRRNFWIGAGVVLGVAVALLVAYGLRQSARASAARDLRDAEASAANTVTDGVTAALEGLEWRAAPDLLGLPADLAASLAATTDDAGIAAAGQLADQLLPALADARTKLDALDVLGAVRDRGFGQLFVLRLLDAKKRMLDALDLYRSAAEIATQTAALDPGLERDTLLGTARSLAAQAATVFQDGYQRLNDAQAMAGTYDGPQIPGQPAALPSA